MSIQKFKKGMLASSIALVLAGGATPFAMAAEEVKAAEQETEVIEVRGIRGSLKQALNQKRFSNAVVDSISAEDIGKFPDRNIAESLQRIPGVTIARSFAGEGGDVSIRGTNSELTQISMNGNYVASTGWFSQAAAKRSFDMDLLPPELVAGVDVYKSPTASLDEGGVGGTVVVRTRKPLELDSNTLFLSAEYQDNSLSDENGQGLTGMYSWKNDQENFGVLASLSTLETVGRAHKAENYMDDGWAGAGISEFAQTRERDAVDLTVQYSPSEDLSMNVHYFQVDLDSANSNQNYLIIAGTDPTGFNDQVTGATKFSPTNGFALNGNYSGAPLDDQNTRNAEMDTEVIAFEVDYTADTYSINAKVGSTEATGGDGGNYNAGWVSSNSNTSIDFDMSGDNAMLLSPNGTDPSNHSEYILSSGAVTAGYRKDEETFAQFDVDFNVEWGPISNFKTGVKLRDHQFTSYSDAWTFDDSLTTGITKATFADGHFNHSGAGLLSGTPTNIARADGAQLRAHYDAHKTGSSLNTNSYGVIKEDIFALYGQADFSGDNYRGNFGLRYVATDTSADYYGYVDTATIVTEDSDYSDWLPSFNLALNLHEDVILRLSAAKVMSRPNYSFLNPAASVNETTRSIARGSIALDPYRANQYDIGLEWYFNEESLLSATLFSKDIRSFIINGANESTVDVNGVDYILREPGQGLGGELQGIEGQYQQQMGEFGWSANITYTEGFGLQNLGADGGGIVERPLPGMSKLSYNLSAYYETDLISARVAYTYRDEFIAPSTGIGGNTAWDAHGFFDANVTWHATENLDVSVEGSNLFEETTTQRFGEGFTAMRLAADNGRNVFLKVSYRL
ncbi:MULTISPECIES: TonB-dependent receptor [unclassified Colwellia]|uniref:TonB-dependent receptor n=1 Tax=unclassified Colwellia TaxID=196834 RepID=UPI0015F62838|nr:MULTISPECIES: TonB-dependent receptor [unclassified Colwellia]MBA6363059.1 TonB-dependent receptor [Colwellia sp. BRX8-8]MBA6348156.1 TonB-dependent receptor [Colwellia sp. BRX8-9]MBA6351338.1 TonB-dependent receptor [Colwellia sp. BRX9-1]MBA6354572.1 TonB-dependent receptor [Colwellia sp. BRX8-3]MBA6359015.1 TonB-dependent receptor [Colwellia sp. BRX8-6]